MKRVLLMTALLVATTSVSGCWRVICPDGRLVVDSAGNPLVVYSVYEQGVAERQHCTQQTDTVDMEPPEENNVPEPTDTTQTAAAVAVTTAVVAAVAGGGSSNSTNGTTK